MSLFEAFSQKCRAGGSEECKIAECLKRGCVNKRLDEHARAIKNEAAFHHLLSASQRALSFDHDDPESYTADERSPFNILSKGVEEALKLSHGERPIPSETAPRQSIKGAWIDGGYVIVTPTGRGKEPAERLMKQILELFPNAAPPDTPARPDEARLSGSQPVQATGHAIPDGQPRPADSPAAHAPVTETVTLTERERVTINNLLGLARALDFAMDDSEEMSDGNVQVPNDHVNLLVVALECLKQLPDDRPGYVMTGPAKAKWALRRLGDDLGGEHGLR